MIDRGVDHYMVKHEPLQPMKQVRAKIAMLRRACSFCWLLTSAVTHRQCMHMLVLLVDRRFRPVVWHGSEQARKSPMRRAARMGRSEMGAAKSARPLSHLAAEPTTTPTQIHVPAHAQSHAFLAVRIEPYA